MGISPHRKTEGAMYKTLVQNTSKKDNNQRWLRFLLKQIELYISPLQKDLDQVLDKRLVRTFSGLFTAIFKLPQSSDGFIIERVRWLLARF